MKVFVTGSQDFSEATSPIASSIWARGRRVRNMVGGDRHNLPEGIQFEEADCCDVDAMKRLTKGTDVVYHCRDRH